MAIFALNHVLTASTWLRLIAPRESTHPACRQSAVTNDVCVYSRELLHMCGYIWQVKHALRIGVTYVRLTALHERLWGTPVQGRMLRNTQTRRVHGAEKISMHSNALVWALLSVSLSHFHTHTRTRRAAHLANRPHYTGGWTIDPLVEELKKSPFSSPPSRMCDTMSWSYLPALCSIKANLTCSPKTFHMTAGMSAAQCGGWTVIFFKCNFRGWEFEHFALQWAS